MSLIKLLAVGRSIIGGQSEFPRFAIMSQAYLPKFGAGNELAKDAPPGSLPSASGLVLRQNPSKSGLDLLAGNMTSAGPAQDRGDALTDITGTKRAAGEALRTEKALAPTKSLLRFLNPFAARRAAQSNRGSVRGGARLDTLQVVRSALDEVEVELVPAQNDPNDGNLPRKGRGGARSAMPGQRWSVLAARLFEVGRLRR